jgi:hypothetical protein
MKCKEVMTHILSDTMPSWMKYHDEKDIRIVRKVIKNCIRSRHLHLYLRVREFKDHLLLLIYRYTVLVIYVT